LEIAPDIVPPDTLHNGILLQGLDCPCLNSPGITGTATFTLTV
jgi:hypothetical protein